MLENHFKRQLVLFFLQDHIVFFTNKVDTSYHQHNYIQLTFALERPFLLDVGNNAFQTEGVIIDSNKRHKIQGTNGWQLYLLINPESNFGEALRQKLKETDDVYCFHFLTTEMKMVVQSIKSVNDQLKYESFLHKLKQSLGIQIDTLENPIDQRVQQVLDYITNKHLEKIKINELSRHVYLSESRLSHLFKKEMGISLTSYLLHEKLKRAFKLAFSGATMTDAALEAGFNSSSHFTRCARDKLGMTPSSITKDSIYLKV